MIPLPRNRFLPSLPVLSGPFRVATVDYETEEANLTTEPRATADPPISRSKSFFVRLFYPSALEKGSSSSHPASPPLVRTAWLPHWKYAVGYGDFMKLPRLFSLSTFLPLMKSVTSETFENEPLCQPEEVPLLPAGDGHQVDGDAKLDRYPCMIFSHGLGGMRSTYSHICSEMASYGFVVVAIEHGDFTASSSVRHNGTEVQCYEQMKKDADEFLFRNPQLRERARDCRTAMNLLRRMHEGNVPASILGGPPAPIASFLGRLAVDDVVLVGHSFGGATVLETVFSPLAAPPEDAPSPFRCVVALDTWMIPLSLQTYEGASRRKVPILFVNNQKFQWKKNVFAMYELVDQNPEQSTIVTLTGAQHQNHSDFALLFPTLLRKFKMIGDIDPYLAISLNNRLMLNFIHRYMRLPMVKGCPNLFAQDTVLDLDDAKRPPMISFDTGFPRVSDVDDSKS